MLIAIVAGTAALWIGTWVRSTRATIGASLIMGVAVSGMHYTGMAAMRVSMGSMSAMGGSTGVSFLVPLLVGITVVTFIADAGDQPVANRGRDPRGRPAAGQARDRVLRRQAGQPAPRLATPLPLPIPPPLLLTLSMTPSEAEIRADAEMRQPA